jgi:hypothetical protein
MQRAIKPGFNENGQRRQDEYSRLRHRILMINGYRINGREINGYKSEDDYFES